MAIVARALLGLVALIAVVRAVATQRDDPHSGVVLPDSGSIFRLNRDTLIEVGRRLDSASVLALYSTSRFMRETLSETLWQHLFDSVFVSSSLDPNLSFKITSLYNLLSGIKVDGTAASATSIATVRDLFSRAIEEQILTLYDRIMAFSRFQTNSVKDLLSFCSLNSGNARFPGLLKAALLCQERQRQDSAGISTDDEIVAMSDDEFFASLDLSRDLPEGVLLERLRTIEYRRCQHALIRYMVSRNEEHRLFEREFLLLLLQRWNVRLGLGLVLFYVQYPAGLRLDRCFPFYRSIWPYSLCENSSPMRWNFFQSLRLLKSERSATKLDRIWSIQPLYAHFALSVHTLPGPYLPHQFDCLAWSQFPDLKMFLETSRSSDGLSVLHWACQNTCFHWLASLLGSSAVQTDLDQSVPDSFGYPPGHYVPWNAVSKLYCEYRPLFEALFGVPAISLNMEVAKQIVIRGGVCAFVTPEYVFRKLLDQEPLIISMLLKAQPVAQPVVVEVGSVVCRSLRAHLQSIGDTAADPYSCASAISRALNLCPVFLASIVNVREPSTGQTLLHRAFQDFIMIPMSRVLGLPGLDVTIRDNFGRVPFSYIPRDDFAAMAALLRFAPGPVVRALVCSAPAVFVDSVAAHFDRMQADHLELLLLNAHLLHDCVVRLQPAPLSRLSHRFCQLIPKVRPRRWKLRPA